MENEKRKKKEKRKKDNKKRIELDNSFIYWPSYKFSFQFHI